MHRRMSLGVALLLVLVVVAGAGSVSAEPLSTQGKAAAASFDPLGWAWDWLTSLLAEVPGLVDAENGGLSGIVTDGGVFIDPNG